MAHKTSISFPHIQRIDFTYQWGFLVIEMCAIFDDRYLTEEMTRKKIYNYDLGQHDPEIVFMTQQQFNTVFKSIIDATNEN